MYRSNSPYGFDSSSYAGSVQSIQSNGYSVDDRSSQISNLSRPSAKSIYKQRKEYSDSITKIMDKFHYRVEHLFTCDLDGGEVRDVNDCVERLNLLDGMGRVWGQDMVLEVRDGNLLLTDIETKEELESLPLSSIVELKAVMDSCVYNSLLTATVKDRSKRTTSVFMFQCEDLRADFIKRDLERALPHQREDVSNHSNNSRGNLEDMAGHQIVRNLQNTGPPPEQREWTPPEDPSAQWSTPDYDEYPTPVPTPPIPREEPPPPRKETPVQPLFMEDKPEPAPVSPPRPYTETDRKVDILNHIFNDIEIFMGQVAAAAAKAEMKKKKKKKKNKDKGMPPAEEFETCLQKIKYGFNLLGELNGKISNPSAPEFVHCLFSTLAFVVSHCPEELPPTIVVPLLEPECIRLLSEEATPEEDQLWQSLGDPWNIPSTKWPEDDEDIPTYTLEFYDGWQPPEVTHSPPGREPERRQQNQSQSTRSTPEKSSAQWKPPPSRPDEPNPSYMRVMYDFTARNNRELSISKGEVVQLLDMSKKWWKVRNDRGEEGFVPNNILESLDKEQEKQETSGSPSLTKRSKPDQVKAWLEYKGFSKITVRCLGVLSGSMLLGMTREELKIVCPEEGGRVFFLLQNIKSAMALASEVRPIEP
ncbi:epidermal growth factor receptor kinase substrate 8-like protein 3 [Coregonus clupeaformis]|uniref:epidermal growth factor receptor kinase substrate 8-like protein 3 n=1 Tax=Coregonus clupeaformis TaxID=59861 RepID=UPI001E1C91B6|nr:epidermal growth factor receptor kinase substrate 8-like protein 3 [Coregonus clupeaformis]XP_041747322.2 epidermal growth factor receptor kinase substrate 8-like protein 3 [Coregonus clupeaformis]